MGLGAEFCPPDFTATRRKGPGYKQSIVRHHVRVYIAARRLRSFRGDTMKSKLTLTIVFLALYCACAAAQQAPAATASAPYAGATISDFKGKVSIQLPAQAFAAPVRGEVLPADTTVSTDDGRLLLKLSDGSDILVRPHTRLVIKEPESSAWRYLQLLIGRIRSQVK